MGMIKRNTKKLLGSRVRIGFLTFPLWVAGALFLAKKLHDRRRA
jgi:hypothetical protein